MTPDWAVKPIDVPYANFGNPQSLNLYAYVENNPTTFGDPDGHQQTDSANKGGGGCDDQLDHQCHSNQQQQMKENWEANVANAQNTVQNAVEHTTQRLNDFIKTYIQAIDSNIPFSGISSPSANNGVEKAAVTAGFLAGFAVPEGEAAKGTNSVYTIVKDGRVPHVSRLSKRGIPRSHLLSDFCDDTPAKFSRSFVRGGKF